MYLGQFCSAVQDSHLSTLHKKWLSYLRDLKGCRSNVASPMTMAPDLVCTQSWCSEAVNAVPDLAFCPLFSLNTLSN